MDGLVSLIDLFLTVLSFAIIARALYSWIDPTYNSSIGRILIDITEPIVGPLRRVIPAIGMFDISSIVALLLIQVLQRLLHQALL